MKKKLLIMVLIFFCMSFLWSQTYLDPNASIEARVEDLLSRMTLAEKCGQMLQAEKNALDPGNLANYCIGSILSGANSTAEPHNTATDWADMYDNFQNDALNGRLGIPVIYGVDTINNWDGFIAVWLPGTEGQGVADLLFGDYYFTGKLPCTWPRDMNQVPINVGDSSYDPLFAYDYGLTYSHATPVPTNPPIQNPGDVDDDGDIDIIDALLVAQYYVGLDPVQFNQENADVDCDDDIDIIDALLIAQYYVGLIDSFCS